jgi:hypothetical protein
MVNKKGWLKILEVFFTILLITGAALIIIEKEGFKEDNFNRIYENEISILREIELNETLRANILNSSVPLEGKNFDGNLSSVKEKIDSKTLSYMECEAKLCEIDSSCLLDISTEEEIYTKSITLFANLTRYAPRKLKLFCWKK